MASRPISLACCKINLSDLQIRQSDKYRTVNELFELHDVLFRDLTTRMQSISRKEAFPRPGTEKPVPGFRLSS